MVESERPFCAGTLDALAFALTGDWSCASFLEMIEIREVFAVGTEDLMRSRKRP